MSFGSDESRQPEPANPEAVRYIGRRFRYKLMLFYDGQPQEKELVGLCIGVDNRPYGALPGTYLVMKPDSEVVGNNHFHVIMIDKCTLLHEETPDANDPSPSEPVHDQAPEPGPQEA